ncbi:MAG: hypothetical protein EOP06_00445 [Proteobacteria bacterium]|nr:MAG: hypothetical protein EOP06_00445 [Pseudomonadota bacterium]
MQNPIDLLYPGLDPTVKFIVTVLGFLVSVGGLCTAVAGFVLGILNYRRGIEKEELEIAVSEFTDEHDLPKHRIVLVNQGNVVVTIRRIKQYSRYVHMPDVAPSEKETVYNLMDGDEPITLEPHSAKSIVSSRNPSPRTLNVSVTTTRNTKYRRFYANTNLVSRIGTLLGKQAAEKLNNYDDEDDWTSLAKSIRAHFISRVTSDEFDVNDPDARIEHQSDEVYKYLAEHLGGVYSTYTFKGKSYLKIEDRFINATKEYLEDANLGSHMLDRKRPMRETILEAVADEFKLAAVQALQSSFITRYPFRVVRRALEARDDKRG